MSFRNNQMFQRPNQFQTSTPQAFNQQQQLGNVRFTTNTSTARMQNMFNPLQTSVQAGMPPWGAGVAVQAGQQNFQPQIIPAGLQNPAMANMTNPQQNAANMMGLLANQQLLAQAAGLVATPGLGVGMQVPFTGQGILGAGPMRGQLPQVFQNVGQTGLGNSGQYSPKSNMNQRNSKSSNQNRGRQSNDRSSGNKDQRSFDRSRSDNRGSRDQSKDRKIREDKKDPRREDRRGDQKSNRGDDQRNFDQRDSKNVDRRRDGSRDNRKYDQPDDRRSDFREDRKNRNDRNIDRLDDRRDVRKDDKNFLRKDEGKRDDKSGDKRKPFSDRKEIDRRSTKGDNRNKGEGDRSKGDNDRSRDFGRRSNQGSRSRRDDDQSDNASSPDKKRTRTKDSTKASTSSKKSKPEDQESYSEVEDTIEDVIEEEIPAWLRCSPSDLYFTRDNKSGCLLATKRMRDLEDRFENEVILRAERIRDSQPKVDLPSRPPPKLHIHKQCCSHQAEDSCSSSSDSSDGDDDDDDDDEWIEELNKKKKHPYRLHEELWYNDPGEMNAGPLCRCSIKSKKTGIRHNKYPGEEAISACDPESNNSNKLYHYKISMSPPTNFLTKCPSIIDYDNHEYIFEGYSLFSHSKLENIPVCKVIRFNIEYSIQIVEQELLQNFTVRSLDLFCKFLFTEILELVDIDWKGPGDSEHCNRYHLMPRFARSLPENGKEILSMNEVLNYLLRSSKPMVDETMLKQVQDYDANDWQNIVDDVRGMVVTYPGMKPCSLRIDQLDRSHGEDFEDDGSVYPLIIHFGIRPAQLSYAGDPNYQKLWKQFVKFKHLLNSKPKILFTDKQKLQQKEDQLNELRLKNTMKREVTVEISAKGFVRTGIKSDITQHTMLIPVLLDHLRFHNALTKLEKDIQYNFQDRGLLQLALTHTSYKVKYGTNTDHARNSLSNCGMRQLEYGDRKIHFQHTRKRGINILINIMSRMGNKEEMLSEIPHNERLEFLGDAVVEFISSVHLFFMFPWLEEGGLTSYRTALVQNQHLAVLAKNLHLDEYMLYAHGPDLCHESDLKHAMANCFEALMGALFLDGGIEVTDRIFSNTLFGDSDELLQTWKEIPLHPLQEDEPNGDRHWIESSPALQKLLKFEEITGIQFDHIRLLARAFTVRSVGYNNLTLGHNQRLEFLGDTVLQLVASEYLFKHFPDHHEGHLSLLRSSLVNNRTQSIVSDDLGMSDHIIHAETRGESIDMKTKEKADLLEAFIGGLYVDKGLTYCRVFCHVCFFPRLQDFIKNQVWNDPKSQLQQCCLTLRDLDGGEPDIPIYKMIESIGPTNTRRYKVAVYFKGERLATGTGHSIQQAEMAAAHNSLKERSELFPILAHQKRFLERKYKSIENQRR
uniref:Ribonuclease 3 n=1 Tax=Mytilus galloprovincialis TaxID=29158 RepID=A0A140H122_MYTGA|nr:DROSHA [Mytilus galloprovincialis]